MNEVKEKIDTLTKERAWLEIRLDNLENNINEIKKLISKDTKIMAVVKANAYGHGIVEISKKLFSLGIRDFAVATLEEAITLRENNIKGNILILGYTNITNIKYILKYDLIQTIVDYEYANKISKLRLNTKIKAHIKINTGMNRLGENYKNISKIKEIFNMDNINILGTYTHLCVSDSLKREDVTFTQNQINNFYNLIDNLKKSGYNPGKIHLQSSYGLLNYPGLVCDYVRTGIIMYGIHSQKNMKTKININLKPVLSLKARITSIKTIEANETVGYGRKYKSPSIKKIASVGVGYADGYPRNLSGKDPVIQIKESYAKIIGRICMDQLMIDVSNIENIKEEDAITLVGNTPLISIEELASMSGTITNELLSRMGSRLKRIIK